MIQQGSFGRKFTRRLKLLANIYRDQQRLASQASCRDTLKTQHWCRLCHPSPVGLTWRSWDITQGQPPLLPHGEELFELASLDLTFGDCRVDFRMIISLSVSMAFLMSVPTTGSWKFLITHQTLIIICGVREKQQGRAVNL